MATLSSPGIGSGLDVNSIVTQLVALDRQPVQQLQTVASSIQTQISSYGKLQSVLSSLHDAAARLASIDTWSQRTATSSDSSALTATVTASGTPANYTIKPTQLTRPQANASPGFINTTDPVGTGTLTIETGTWFSDDAFATKQGTTAVNVTIGPDDNTLEKVRDKINGANAGVKASIVWDGSYYRLTMTGTNGGVANGFRVTAADDDGDPTDAAGLSRLSYDPSNGITQMGLNQSATDAVASINNLEVHSTSNLFDQAIADVSFSINKDDGAAVNLSVGYDQNSMKQAVQNFVTAYNSVNNLARSLTKVDPTNSANNGALQGDRTAINLGSQLRALVGGNSASGGTFSRLSDIGITAATDGTLSITDTKLSAALNDPAQLRTLFNGNGTTDGIAAQLRNVIDNMTNTDGTIASTTTSLQARLKRNQQDQDTLNTRADATETRLRAQYSALDTQMASMNSLQSYLSQQIAGWNK